MGKTIVQAAIRLYQRVLSPLLGPRCRFYPSCSQYALDACEIHGLVKGLGLTLKRLARCHPFHPGGLDPVPPLVSSQSVLSQSPPTSHCSKATHVHHA